MWPFRRSEKAVLESVAKDIIRIVDGVKQPLFGSCEADDTVLVGLLEVLEKCLSQLSDEDAAALRLMTATLTTKVVDHYKPAPKVEAYTGSWTPYEAGWGGRGGTGSCGECGGYCGY